MVDRARWTSKVALLVLAIVSTAHAASWTSTGQTVHVIDWRHYALRLASGKVMLVDMQGIVELYDPETRTFSLGAPVPHPLERQVPGIGYRVGWVALLADARALAVAARDDGVHGSWSYDPDSDKWVPRPDPIAARSGPGVALLGDGRLLVAGGAPGDSEAYDPKLDAWSPMPKPPSNVRGAVGLADGRALFESFLFDPATSSWSPVGGSGPTWLEHVTALSDGGAFALGDLSYDAFRFDPKQMAWLKVPDSHFDHTFGAVAQLDDGDVLVVGSIDANDSDLGDRVELYDPGSNGWSITRRMHRERSWHSATKLLDGTVLVVGGDVGDQTAELYDPKGSPKVGDCSIRSRGHGRGGVPFALAFVVLGMSRRFARKAC